MSPLVMAYLPLILFFPWIVLVSVFYWVYPRHSKTTARRLFDAGALICAYIGFILSMHWSMGIADQNFGNLWPQVLSTSVAYGVFLGVLVVAYFVRRLFIVEKQRIK